MFVTKIHCMIYKIHQNSQSTKLVNFSYLVICLVVKKAFYFNVSGHWLCQELTIQSKTSSLYNQYLKITNSNYKGI